MNKKAQINTINLLFGLSVILFVVFGGIVWGLGIIYASDKLGLLGEIILAGVGIATLIIELIKKMI